MFWLFTYAFFIDECSVYIMKKQLKINYGGKMQVYGQPVVWSQLNYEAENQLLTGKDRNEETKWIL